MPSNNEPGSGRRNVLFVEAHASALEQLRQGLEHRQSTWQMQFVVGAEGALKACASHRYDAVVSVLRMPGMSGIELLKQVKQLYPGVLRVAMAEPADDDKLTALPVVHQFLEKPCSARDLESTVDRALSVRDCLGRGEMRGVVGHLDSMPSVPRLYFELSKALNDPNVSLNRIGGIIEQDIAMTARLLQVANSAGFGVGRRISTVGHAVTFLGTDALRTMVLSASLFRAFEQEEAVAGFSIEDLHDHSVRTGGLARRLVSDLVYGPVAYAAGLLHDVGMLVLATRLPDQFRRAQALAAAEGCLFYQAEQRENGVTHCEIGAFLLGTWGLPITIVEAVAQHHQPRNGKVGEVDAIGAVHIANALVSEHQRLTEPEAAGPPSMPAGEKALPPDEDASMIVPVGLDGDYLETIGKRADLPRWRALAEEFGV